MQASQHLTFEQARAEASQALAAANFTRAFMLLEALVKGGALKLQSDYRFCKSGFVGRAGRTG